MDSWIHFSIMFRACLLDWVEDQCGAQISGGGDLLWSYKEYRIQTFRQTVILIVNSRNSTIHRLYLFMGRIESCSINNIALQPCLGCFISGLLVKVAVARPAAVWYPVMTLCLTTIGPSGVRLCHV